ncbi:hypothetical protein AVEN_60300-1 [Araneus ventricosus]|uniref:Uncharacterized protein n=1 Tax=Araneus ventricosus TaxID=182803 RepID=A0A4Y1ZMX7_ARAVE|nr:hypothetical protein AVEN_60300-1 [Araneus ventricosus]
MPTRTSSFAPLSVNRFEGSLNWTNVIKSILMEKSARARDGQIHRRRKNVSFNIFNVTHENLKIIFLYGLLKNTEKFLLKSKYLVVISSVYALPDVCTIDHGLGSSVYAPPDVCTKDNGLGSSGYAPPDVCTIDHGLGSSVYTPPDVCWSYFKISP